MRRTEAKTMMMNRMMRMEAWDGNSKDALYMMVL
jgi:hypothetical protein